MQFITNVEISQDNQTIFVYQDDCPLSHLTDKEVARRNTCYSVYGVKCKHFVTCNHGSTLRGIFCNFDNKDNK